MSEFVTIAFTPLREVRRPAAARSGDTLVVFVGADLAPTPAAAEVLGRPPPASRPPLPPRRFKGKAKTALDILAPAGLGYGRLLVVGTEAKAKAGAAGATGGRRRSRQTRRDRQRDGVARRLRDGQAAGRRRVHRAVRPADGRAGAARPRPISRKGCSCAPTSSTATRPRPRTTRRSASPPPSRWRLPTSRRPGAPPPRPAGSPTASNSPAPW